VEREVITLLLFIAYFGLMNMIAGGKFQLRERLGLPGRSIYYAGLITIIVGWLAYGAIGAGVGLSFLIWRLPGWYGAIDAGLAPIPPEKPGQSQILGFEVRPLRLRDFLVMSARGLAACPVFVWQAWVGHTWTPLAVLALASLWQGAAYDLAHRSIRQGNGIAEAGAGVGWGLAYYALLHQG
jgi:hypothetical protein